MGVHRRHATLGCQGYVNTDRRASFAYIAIGMSPAMVEKHRRSRARSTCGRRATRTGAFLDGGKNYRLRLPPNIPVKNFWSVVVYDADSRSMLRNGQPFPSVSTYTGPESRTPMARSMSTSGPPRRSRQARRTGSRPMPGKGWFVIFRFYGPLEPFFDKTWKPDDIVEAK